MSPRAGLTTGAVVDAAMTIVDESGIEALTLAAVAAKTKVATPSLYKHVAGLAELRTLVGIRAMEEMTERLTQAVLGLGGDAAVAALMRAARGYVVEHPHRYAAQPLDPLQNPATHEAGAKLLNVFLAVLRGHGLDGPEAIHATRCLRVIVHGFASLEAGGGFGLPEKLDETYERLIEMFLKSLPSQGGSR
jgi:AcrR family transcriptional regulator